LNTSLLHDCAWLELHLRCRYEQDGAGRLTAFRAPGRPAPPRFVLLRSRHGNVWRLAAGEDAACVRELSRLAGREPGIAADAPLPWSAPERLEPMRRVLLEAGPLPDEWRGAVFRFPDDEASRRRRSTLAAHARELPFGDSEFARRLGVDLPDLSIALDPPGFGVLEDGRWIAACGSSAGAAAGAAHSIVATTAAARGRGLAQRCVAAWAEAVLDSGSLPLCAVGWSQVSALRLAARLGLEIFGEECRLGA
jgi:hypothetical protein